MPPKRDFQNKLEESRKQVGELNTIYQRLKEKISPQPSILPKPRKIHDHKVEASLRPIRKSKKTNGDPANLSTWSVVDLKQFMKEHHIKGISKKKSELVTIIQKYIS